MSLDRLNAGFLCFSPGRFICLGVSSACLWVSCGDIFFLSESRITQITQISRILRIFWFDGLSLVEMVFV